MHYAAGSGYDAICDILIQAGAGVNAVDKVCELLILGSHLGDDPPPHLSQKKNCEISLFRLMPPWRVIA